MRSAPRAGKQLVATHPLTSRPLRGAKLLNQKIDPMSQVRRDSSHRFMIRTAARRPRVVESQHAAKIRRIVSEADRGRFDDDDDDDDADGH